MKSDISKQRVTKITVFKLYKFVTCGNSFQLEIQQLTFDRKMDGISQHKNTNKSQIYLWPFCRLLVRILKVGDQFLGQGCTSPQDEVGHKGRAIGSLIH